MEVKLETSVITIFVIAMPFYPKEGSKEAGKESKKERKKERKKDRRKKEMENPVQLVFQTAVIRVCEMHCVH